MEEKMDGQNFNNGQESSSQNSYYQDNSANAIYQPPVEDQGPYKANGMQIASLVLGICSIVLGCCWAWIGIVLGIIGIVLSVMGAKQGKHGIGTAGMVCSIIGLVFGIIGIILSIILGPIIMDMYQEIFEEMGYTYSY